MSDKPLLMLDIDGVLNSYSKDGNRLEHLTEHVVETPEWWDIVTDDHVTMWLNPQHTEQINRLSGAYTPVWATSWVDHANGRVGALLNLPEYDVVMEFPGPEDESPDLHWKTPGLSAYAQDENGKPLPFVWVDDEATDADAEWLAENHGAPTLVITPERNSGLQSEHFQELKSWAGSFLVQKSASQLTSAVRIHSDPPKENKKCDAPRPNGGLCKNPVVDGKRCHLHR